MLNSERILDQIMAQENQCETSHDHIDLLVNLKDALINEQRHINPDYLPEPVKARLLKGYTESRLSEMNADDMFRAFCHLPDAPETGKTYAHALRAFRYAASITNDNTNCLQDMCCPECRSKGPFLLMTEGTDPDAFDRFGNRLEEFEGKDIPSARYMATWDDDGSEDTIGDTEFVSDGDAECRDCCHTGTVSDFYIKNHIKI